MHYSNKDMDYDNSTLLPKRNLFALRPDPALDQITGLAARLFQVRGVFVSVIGDAGHEVRSSHGCNAAEALPVLGLCAPAVLFSSLILVEDTAQDPRFADLRAANTDTPVRFFAGAPLCADDGLVLGMLCLLDDQPRLLSPSEQDTLWDLATLVMREAALQNTLSFAGTLAAEKQAREQWFHALAQNRGDMVTVLDAGGKALYQNPSSERMLGFLSKLSFAPNMAARIHPQDQVRALAFWECVRVVPGSHPPIELRVRHQNGGFRLLEASCDNRLDDPAVGGIVVNARDVTRCRHEEAARRLAETRLETVMRTSPLAIFSFDLQGRIESWNTAAETTFGWSQAEVQGKFLPMVLPERHEHLEAAQASLLRGETITEQETCYQTKSGARREANYSCEPLRSVLGQVCGGIVVMSDISRRKQDEAALAHAEEKFRGIFEHATEGIFQTTPAGRFVSANPSMARILGYETPAALIESVTDIAAHIYADETRRAEFIHLMETQNFVTDFVAQVYRTNGTLVWISANAHAVRDEKGRLACFEGTVEDITERITLEAEREGQLAEALERADHDPLTGLLNHRAFHRALEQEADRTLREGSTLAIAVLDLDNFKFFNDAYGHAVGDDVLRQVASTLSVNCRSYDTLARFGGDEFAMLLPGLTASQADEFAQRLRSQAQNIGFQPPGCDTLVPLGLSVGIAIFPDENPGRLEALARADARLMRAKSGGQDEATERLRAGLNQSMDGFSMLDALVTAVDNKDRYTRRHSEDVMRYSVAIARALGLDEKTQRLVEVAGLLHDVGKIGVPDAILRKPGSLSDAEFHAVRHHPMMGSIIVSSVPGFEDMLDAVRHHHERWDGEGYPFGLCGQEIPLVARIMAVADAFSAMTTDRPYRKGMNPMRACAILERGAGTQWDPDCVTAFAEAHRLSQEAREAEEESRRTRRRVNDALPSGGDSGLKAQEDALLLRREAVLSRQAANQALNASGEL